MFKLTAKEIKVLLEAIDNYQLNRMFIDTVEYKEEKHILENLEDRLINEFSKKQKSSKG